MDKRQPDEMHIWAERTAKKIDESAVFMQLYNPDMTSLEEAKNDPAYILQLGYAVMADKPIIVLAAMADEIPEKLERIADVVERYDRGSMDSVGKAAERAINKIKSFE